MKDMMAARAADGRLHRRRERQGAAGPRERLRHGPAPMSMPVPRCPPARTLRLDYARFAQGAVMVVSGTMRALVIAAFVLAAPSVLAGSVERAIDGDDICLCGDDVFVRLFAGRSN